MMETRRNVFGKRIVFILVGFITVLCLVETVSAQTGTLIDTRDGKKYKTVKIGTQTWMAENMNFFTKESRCRFDKTDNCEKYGRLYLSDETKTVCPVGWHLPTRGDWKLLIRIVEGNSIEDNSIAGKRLKSKSGWNWNDDGNISGNGTDDFGFSALPSGYLDDADFSPDGVAGAWWTSKDRYGNYHLIMIWFGNDDVIERGEYEFDLSGGDSDYIYIFCSVRCIQN